MINPYYERLKIAKANNLMSLDRLVYVATIFLTWGKITEEEYDDVLA